MRTLLLLLFSSTALAQSVGEIPGDARLRPTLSREGVHDIPSAEVGEHLDADLGILLDWSQPPHGLDGHLVGALGLGGLLRLGVNVPVAFLGTGELRAVGRLGLLKRADHFVDLSVGLDLSASTDASVRVDPELALSTYLEDPKLRLNSVLSLSRWGLGLRWDAGRWVDDIAGAYIPADLELSVLGYGLAAEMKAGLGYSLTESLRISAAFGFGVGALPDTRVFVHLRYADRIRDRDNDGLPDSEDQCPRRAEDRDRFQDWDGCPDPDNDEDGVLDVDDACPWIPGDPETGCPAN